MSGHHMLTFPTFTNLRVVAACSCGRWQLEVVPLLGDTEAGVREYVRECFAPHHTRASRVICDGCNVLPPHEHRCHGARAQVKGEPAGKPCECPECHALLPGDRICSQCRPPVRLVDDMSRPGYEYRCPVCGRFEELFGPEFQPGKTP